jgi:hypothetical protein
MIINTAPAGKLPPPPPPPDAILNEFI